jgi:hypothetical protein
VRTTDLIYLVKPDRHQKSGAHLPPIPISTHLGKECIVPFCSIQHNFSDELRKKINAESKLGQKSHAGIAVMCAKLNEMVQYTPTMLTTTTTTTLIIIYCIISNLLTRGVTCDQLDENFTLTNPCWDMGQGLDFDFQLAIFVGGHTRQHPECCVIPSPRACDM